PAPPWQGGAPADAAASAGWLAAQLAANGDVLPGAAGADWGLTIDALLGLAATGLGADQAAATAAKLAASGEAYIGAAGDPAKWAAVAKMALALQVAGLDPAAFPASPVPRNLIAELRAAQNADGSFGAGDMAFTHPLALIALARTDGGAPPARVDWLAAQRCADPSNAAYGSYGWAAGCGAADPDATAMAIQGLAAAGVGSQEPALADAVAWLRARQDAATGGFAGSYSGPNANTTGLAASALRLAGAQAAALAAGPASLDTAAAFIGGLTLSCAQATASGAAIKVADVGAIAFDADGLAEAEQYGLDQTNTDQFRRSTAQAVLALGGPALAELTLAGAAGAAPAATCAPAGAPAGSGDAAGSAASGGGSGQLAVSGAAWPAGGLGLLAGLLALSGAALLARRRAMLEGQARR
ncbi:MAG: hypothetical protein LBD51_06970, partial [Bifidobacteriaceae bacterium]|nr:hypothetical protein [Bifidobacteriaceae bacterium]